MNKNFKRQLRKNKKKKKLENEKKIILALAKKREQNEIKQQQRCTVVEGLNKISLEGQAAEKKLEKLLITQGKASILMKEAKEKYSLQEIGRKEYLELNAQFKDLKIKIWEEKVKIAKWKGIEEPPHPYNKGFKSGVVQHIRQTKNGYSVVKAHSREYK